MGLNTHLRLEMTNFKQPHDASDAAQRIQPNMTFFQVNYFYLAILTTSIYVAVFNPYSLIAMAVLLSIAVFLNIWKDPIQIGDNFISMAVLSRIYILLSVIFYASFAGIHFLAALLVGALLIIIHAVLHNVETTRSLKEISTLSDAAGSDVHYYAKRGYDLFLVAIGAEESSEIYNMASIPKFLAKEIKQDFKDIKSSMKDLFK